MATAPRRRSSQKPKSPGQLLLLLLLAVAAYLFSLYSEKLLPAPGSAIAVPDGAWVRLEVIDVGQADCLLLTSAQGESMLIDAGNRSDEKVVLDYLRQRGIAKLDYVVATHPHEDHIGSMAAVINTFPIGVFYTPDAISTTATYEAMLSALERKNVNVVEAHAGVKLPWKAGSLEFIAPRQDQKYKELNDYSAVLFLRFGETTFLLCGDAETTSEGEMLQAYNLPQINVLKTGHHGSSTSSSNALLQKIQPEIALISCGSGNSYGHPHRETLTALNNIGTRVYRTDLRGHLILTSDGTSVTVATQKGGAS